MNKCVQSFSPIIQFHKDAALGSSVPVFASFRDAYFMIHASLDLFYYAYCVRVFMNFENGQNSYKIDVRIFKAQLISGCT